MPEPDFLQQTVYTAPKLTFGNLFKTRQNTTPISNTRRASNFDFGSLIGYKTNDDFALDAVNNALSYPQSQTVAVDGGVSIMSALKGTAAAILSNMGSTGDAPIQAQPVSFTTGGSNSGGILGDPVVLIGLVLGAGVLIYMANK